MGIRIGLNQVVTLFVLGVVWGAAVALSDHAPWFRVSLAMVFISPVVLAVSYSVALRRFWNAEAGAAAPLGVRFFAGVSQGLTIVSLFVCSVLALVTALTVAHTIATWPSNM